MYTLSCTSLLVLSSLCLYVPYKCCMATKAVTKPLNIAMHTVHPVSRPPEAALVGGQLTTGCKAAQAVEVRAAEMLLAAAELTWAAHGLPATSGCTSEKTAQVLRPSYCAGSGTFSVPVRLKARWLMLEHEAAVPAVAAMRSGGWAPL